MLGISRALLGLTGLNGASAVPCNTQTNQLNCFSVPGKVGAAFLVLVVFAIVVFIFALVCEVKIISKAGYSGWLVLTAFVPIVNIVMFIIFAFGKWPIQEQLEAAQRAAGRGYSPPPFAQGPPPGPVPGPMPGTSSPSGAAGSAGTWAPPSAQPGTEVPPSASPVAVDLQTRDNNGVIYCSWCGKERAIDAPSIHHCGSRDRPPVYCMHCGTPFLDGASKCALCGTPSTQLSTR